VIQTTKEDIRVLCLIEIRIKLFWTIDISELNVCEERRTHPFPGYYKHRVNW
jgi:hypothetical protein